MLADWSVALRLLLLSACLILSGKVMAERTEHVVGSRYVQVGYDLTRDDLAEEMESFRRAPATGEDGRWSCVLLVSVGLIASGFLLRSRSRLGVRLACLGVVSVVAFVTGSQIQRQNVMKVAAQAMVSHDGRILSDAEKDVLNERERCLRPPVEVALRKQMEHFVRSGKARRDREGVERALKTVLYHDKVCWDLCHGYPYERLREMAWEIYGL